MRLTLLLSALPVLLSVLLVLSTVARAQIEPAGTPGPVTLRRARQRVPAA
jgi:hypothetical protein